MTNNVYSVSEKPILEVIEQLQSSGKVELYAGRCMEAIGVVAKALQEIGIKSVTVECAVLITHTMPDGSKNIITIGAANPVDDGSNGYFDNHYVTLTDTNPPYLIDISISKHINPDSPFIFGRAIPGKMLGSFNNGNLNVTYIKKQI